MTFVKFTTSFSVRQLSFTHTLAHTHLHTQTHTHTHFCKQTSFSSFSFAPSLPTFLSLSHTHTHTHAHTHSRTHTLTRTRMPCDPFHPLKLLRPPQFQTQFYFLLFFRFFVKIFLPDTFFKVQIFRVTLDESKCTKHFFYKNLKGGVC